MILPGGYASTLAILVLALLCWSAWANMFKAAGPKWRFELFYIDFAVGVLLAALIGALTLGSLGWDGFSLIDDLRLAGKRQELFAFVAGAVFNLANMLLLGAISVAGLAVAFPIAIGIALFIGSAAAYGLHSQGSLPLVAVGCAVTAASAVCAVLAWRSSSSSVLAVSPEPGAKKIPRKAAWYKAAIVSGIAGLLMAAFPPLIDMARSDENGLGPYSLGMIFAVGVFMTTMVYSLFFMNLPIHGRPVEIGEYLKGKSAQHMYGILSGVLWITGLIAVLAAARVDAAMQPGKPATFALSHAPALVAALCGIVLWREFAAGSGKGRTLLGLSMFLFAVGLAMLSLAPAYGA